MSTTHATPITKTNKRASTYILQRRYKTSDHMEGECAPALRTNPAYLSRVSPASRRHVGGRPDIFVLSASAIRLHEISVQPISPPGPTPIYSVRIQPP
jgi:hypothetical protein